MDLLSRRNIPRSRILHPKTHEDGFLLRNIVVVELLIRRDILTGRIFHCKKHNHGILKWNIFLCRC